METIAASGTKLNLDYAIDDMLDQYEQQDIIDYFKTCETSSLQVAQQELSEQKFTWEQLKIMRIKFLSVYGNWFPDFNYFIETPIFAAPFWELVR